MFKCDKCGTEIEELPVIEERHECGDGYAYEVVTDWNCSCGGEFEEAVECEACEELVCDSELQNGICPECVNRYANNFETVCKVAKHNGYAEKVYINDLLFALLKCESIDIEYVLWEVIKGIRKTEKGEPRISNFHTREQNKLAKEYALSDLSNFTEGLSELIAEGEI